jgi:hypothetical protein
MINRYKAVRADLVESFTIRDISLNKKAKGASYYDTLDKAKKAAKLKNEKWEELKEYFK